MSPHLDLPPQGGQKHLPFMRRALALARRGGGKVHPNPMVGCVLVKGGRVVGQGWHKRFGGPHAEVEALARAGAAARGATAFVTLEPCSHFGKTPPCADALIRAGVRKVVAAMRDPNPLVNGGGFAKLKEAGIATEAGLLEAQARALNRSFVTRMEKRRPYVILKAAASLDGKLATAGGESKWITSPQARALGHAWRGQCDAILVGVGTVLADDPALTSHGKGKDPLRIVLDAEGRTPKRAKVLRDGGAIVYTAKDVPARKGSLDLKAVLKDLSKRGVGTLLVEGGPAVQTSFLESGLVDEVRVFLAPRLIGGAKAPSFFGGKGAADLDAALKLGDVAVRRVGPDILVTGKVQH